SYDDSVISRAQWLSEQFLSFFFFSSRRRHTRFSRDWSSDVCSSDLRRCSRRSALWAVELRREESRRGLEDRVRPTQLLHLLLEGLDPRGVLTRRAGLQALVDVSSLDPLAHRLDAVPELVRDPLDRPGASREVVGFGGSRRVHHVVGPSA